MAVPSNICIAWPSTVLSIPAGWSRETTLDSRYILGASTGADTDLTTDRGATTHTHTSPSHTPTQNAHTHDFSAADGSGSAGIVSGTGIGSASDAGHGHPAATSPAATGTNNGISITVDPTSNDLAFLEVIWIRSDGTPTTFPTGSLAFFASDSLPSGWSRVNGDGYLKGAASGGPGGGTGGANTHSHTSPAHTHTQNAHTHANGTPTASDTAAFGKGTGIDIVASNGHTHVVVIAGGAGTNQSVTTTINSSNHEPPFKKLNIVQAASPSLPTNIIALWLGTNAALAALTDWTRFTSMDGLWLKGASADGQSNVTTGGASSHTHTASDCQPVQNAHTHSASDTGSTGTISSAPGTLNNFAADGHQHTWGVTSTIATNNAIGVTIDANTVNSALPKHRTVIYAQFSGTTPPPTRTGVLTSYDLNLFDIGDPEGKVPPEVAKKIAQGDLRFVPR